MSKGYLYILECANGAYYTGSTKYLDLRLKQHQNGEGANFTKKHLPVKLVYYEEFQRIDEAFYREKQVQGWSRKKKEALMSGFVNKLHELAECKNDTHFRNVVSTSLNKHLDSESPAPFDSAQGAGDSAVPFDSDSSVPFDSDSSVPFDSDSSVPFDSDSSVPFDSDSSVPFDSAQGTGESLCGAKVNGSLSGALEGGLLSGAETNHSQNICIPCGLCCDGTLIGFVQLEREEVPAMRELLDVEEANGNGVFLQPCKNFCGSCGIYSKRPKQCAKFKCELLNSVEENRLDFEVALEMVAEIKQIKIEIEKKLTILQLDLPFNSFYFRMAELKNLLQQFRDESSLTPIHHALISDLEHLDDLLLKNFGDTLH